MRGLEEKRRKAFNEWLYMIVGYPAFGCCHEQPPQAMSEYRMGGITSIILEEVVVCCGGSDYTLC